MQPLSTQAFAELVAALLSAFESLGAVKYMLQFKLGKVLDDIAPPGPRPEVVLELLRAAEAGGWTEALVRAAIDTRPGNPPLRTFCGTHAPHLLAAQPAQDLVKGVSAGLEAAHTILQRPDDPAARALVGQFRSEFKDGRRKFDTLKRYKALHDRLHTLQYQYLRQIGYAAERMRQEEESYLDLQRYATQLRREAAGARQDAVGLPTQPLELGWVDAYERAVSDLDYALAHPEDDKPLPRALRTFKDLLREAPRVNNLLTYTAGELPLEALIAAMRALSEHLDRTAAADGASVPVDAFRAGLADLQRLQPRLAGLVCEHYEWQWLDKEFVAAEALPGRTAADKFPYWELVRDRLVKLCDLSRGQAWADQLVELATALEAEGAAGDALRFGRTFNKFRVVAAERFFQIDKELRELSEELVAVTGPLNLLSGVI
jgi:hypothetical protein